MNIAGSHLISPPKLRFSHLWSEDNNLYLISVVARTNLDNACRALQTVTGTL